MDSQRQSALQTSINNNSMRQTTQTSHQMAVNKYHTMMQPKTFSGDKVANAAAQTGRTPGGMAQGTLKIAISPALAVEALQPDKTVVDPIAYRKGMDSLRELGIPKTTSELTVAASQGKISPDQYRNTMNEWAVNGAPVDRVLNASTKTMHTDKPITEWARGANNAIQSWTDSWVPPPQTEAARFVAKASDALGEAIPVTALAVATSPLGAGAALTGTAASYTAGAANAFSTEMLEGSGDVGRAALSAATEWGAEAAGGKIFGAIAGKAVNPLARSSIDSLGEGTEEVISGVTQAALTGESYTLAQAGEDFAIGLAIGTGIGATRSGINTASEGITQSRIGHEVNARISKAAASDVGNVQTLLARGADSTASAVIAQDSLFAIQKQVANPVNTTQTTSSIPADIAQKYKLAPASDNPHAKPIAIKTLSYEGRVAPEVSKLTAPEISLQERAGIDPNAVDVDILTNPRALYQYADDIYLRPGTNIDGTLFTYRGQASQFYQNSQETGSIPASGVGTSWEGSGVYSALTPYTTDLYGPTGKLADNPYANRGIPQKAIDADYPVGVVLQQSSGLTEDISPLTRADAPNDVVAEDTRRIRYDDKGRGLITEVINNPSDVSVAGLIFGRTGVTHAAPIQYATDNATNNTGGQNDATQLASEQNAVARQMSNDASISENTLGEYVVPNVIKATVGEMGLTAAEGGEQTDVLESMANSLGRTTEGQSFIPMKVKSEAIPLSAKEDTANEMNAAPSAASVSVGTSAAEGDSKISVTETQETAVQVSESSTRQSVETPIEELSAEERASQIWTPAASMANRASNVQGKQQRQKDELPGYDFSTVRGSGSKGQIFETTGYGRTFGGLSSL